MAQNKILAEYGTTIFTTMSDLAREHGAINLGQGFPDEDGPEDVRAEAARWLMEETNQYPPSPGLPALREAVSASNKRHYDLDIPAAQVVVTSGATEALADCLLGLLNPGDEAVVIEPLYDSYMPIIELAGATPRPVRLAPPAWSLPDDLEAAFNDKTKVLLLNSPMNPTGKVFTRAELDRLAALCIKHNVIAVCDEVYEHLAFGAPHIPLMSLPGMFERCVRIGSAGKTFSLTGWKVGYISGPPDLMAAVQRAHQYVTFTTAINLQAGVAYGLGKDDSYFTGLAESMGAKRQVMAAALESIGCTVLPSDGTYFLTVDFTPLGFAPDDLAFCKTITEKAGVGAVPMSAFYAPKRITGRALTAAEKSQARFCFCKREDVLAEAASRLARFAETL